MSSSASSAVRENASGVLYDLLTDAAGAGLLPAYWRRRYSRNAVTARSCGSC